MEASLAALRAERTDADEELRRVREATVRVARAASSSSKGLPRSPPTTLPDLVQWDRVAAKLEGELHAVLHGLMRDAPGLMETVSFEASQARREERGPADERLRAAAQRLAEVRPDHASDLFDIAVRLRDARIDLVEAVLDGALSRWLGRVEAAYEAKLDGAPASARTPQPATTLAHLNDVKARRARLHESVRKEDGLVPEPLPPFLGQSRLTAALDLLFGGSAALALDPTASRAPARTDSPEAAALSAEVLKRFFYGDDEGADGPAALSRYLGLVNASDQEIDGAFTLKRRPSATTSSEDGATKPWGVRLLQNAGEIVAPVQRLAPVPWPSPGADGGAPKGAVALWKLARQGDESGNLTVALVRAHDGDEPSLLVSWRPNPWDKGPKDGKQVSRRSALIRPDGRATFVTPQRASFDRLPKAWVEATPPPMPEPAPSPRHLGVGVGDPRPFAANLGRPSPVGRPPPPSAGPPPPRS